MRWLRGERGWRAMGVLLVALALAVRVAVPSGWMLAAGDGGPRMVICTGHGALTLGDDPAKAPAHQPDKSADHACVFAGAHAAPAPPLLATGLGTAFATHSAPPTVRLQDLRPGRGLAAPPPPSQAPPTLLTEA